ncbi:hypothetical protein NXS19_013843 [Fusarium pseudograminearum]|nr:hypothetical protein NXS19_013843 [Fusarium pseudograminearum]
MKSASKKKRPQNKGKGDLKLVLVFVGGYPTEYRRISVTLEMAGREQASIAAIYMTCSLITRPACIAMYILVVGLPNQPMSH